MVWFKIDGSRVQAKNVTKSRNRHGNEQFRYRDPGGFTFALPKSPEQFWTEYRLAEAGKHPKQLERATTTNPLKRQIQLRRSLDKSSVNWLVTQYLDSPHWAALKDSSRTSRKLILNQFVFEHGERKYDELTPGRVRKLRDKLALHTTDEKGRRRGGPNAADSWIRTLRPVFQMAVDYELIQASPFAPVKMIKPKTQGHTPWTEGNLAQFLAHHPLGTTPHLLGMLAAYTGQRRGDLVAMRWSDIKGDKIAITQEKNSGSNFAEESRVVVRIHKSLAPVLRLARGKGGDHIVQNRFGKPYTSKSIGGMFRDWADEASLPGLSLHGMRKLSATRLIDAGASRDEVMAILGHRDPTVLEIYIRNRNLERLSDRGMDTLEALSNV